MEGTLKKVSEKKSGTGIFGENAPHNFMSAFGPTHWRIAHRENPLSGVRVSQVLRTTIVYKVRGTLETNEGEAASFTG